MAVSAALLLCFLVSTPIPEPVLTEDLVLGLDEAVPLGFPVGAEIDAEGNIYILDLGFETIRKFDAFGKYIIDLSGKGEAPGEFHSAQTMALAPDGNVLVANSGTRITSLSPEGAPRDDLHRHITSRPVSMVFGPAGHLFVVCWDLENQTMVHKYTYPEMEHVVSFGESFAKGTDMDLMIERVYAEGYLEVSSEGNLVCAQAIPQLVKTYDLDGNEIDIIKARFEESPMPFMRKRGVFKVFPRTMSLATLDNGVFVTTFLVPGDDNAYQHLDVYEAGGTRVATKQVPPSFSILCSDTEGRIYVAGTRNGLPVVVRYNISW